MQRLLVLRHGSTEGWRPGLLDSERSLTDEGHAQASALGSWLGSQGWIPDRVVASPSRRTRHTAGHVCRHAGISESAITFDPRVYDANVEALSTVVRERSHAETLMLVGHQPGVGALVMALTGDMDLLHVAPGTLVSLTAPSRRGGLWRIETICRPSDLDAFFNQSTPTPAPTPARPPRAQVA